MLRYDRQLALVSSPCTRHPARKRIGSILATPEPALGDVGVSEKCKGPKYQTRKAESGE